MVVRLIIKGKDDEGRILISKPGFNAAYKSGSEWIPNPLLADENKIFDSDWQFSGGILLDTIIHRRTAMANGGTPPGGLPYPFTFMYGKTFPFVPAVDLQIFRPAGTENGFPYSTTRVTANPVFGNSFYSDAIAYNNRITIGLNEGASTGGNVLPFIDTIYRYTSFKLTLYSL